MDTAITIHGSKGHLGIILICPKGKRNIEEFIRDVLIGQAWKWHSSFLLTFHWLELSHMVMLSFKGIWEM